MKENDHIIIEWESVEVIRYRAVVSIERFAELTGVPVADIVTYDDPEDVLVHAPLGLEDELANIEDDAVSEWETFTRESITTQVKSAKV